MNKKWFIILMAILALTMFAGTFKSANNKDNTSDAIITKQDTLVTIAETDIVIEEVPSNEIPTEETSSTNTTGSRKEPPENPVDYNGNDICMFSKCICIGDSLTAGAVNYYLGDANSADNGILHDYSYPNQLTKLSGIETVNTGVGGITSWGWWARYRDGEFGELTNCDMAIIHLGVNDVSKQEGGFNETSIEAFTNIINKLKTDNKGIKIFICTLWPAMSYNENRHKSASETIRQFVTDLNDKDVHLLDMDKYSRIGTEKAYNYGHLTAYGYHIIANEIKNYISYIISNNKEDFRFIQLIGTDYTHEELYN